MVIAGGMYISFPKKPVSYFGRVFFLRTEDGGNKSADVEVTVAATVCPTLFPIHPEPLLRRVAPFGLASGMQGISSVPDGLDSPSINEE